MNLAARSFANSARMASFFSVENRRRRCFFGFAVLSTSNLCSANFLGTPGLSAGFQAKMTRLCLKKLVSGSSYLGFMLAPIIAVLDGSLVLRSIVLSFTPSGGIMSEADFFVGISSSSRESYLAAIATRGAWLNCYSSEAIVTASA